MQYKLLARAIMIGLPDLFHDIESKMSETWVIEYAMTLSRQIARNSKYDQFMLAQVGTGERIVASWQTTTETTIVKE